MLKGVGGRGFYIKPQINLINKILRLRRYYRNRLLEGIMKNKIAQITLYFWVLKVLATTLGETAGDMMSMTLNFGYIHSLIVTAIILLGILIFQIKSDSYHDLRFWLAIIGTTTVGTEISDMLDRTLGLGYAYGSAILVTGLVFTLLYWHSKEKSLKVYPIARRNLEIMFWIAVLLSNSLGTAFGDFLTSNLGLSYLQGAFVTSATIVVVLVLHYWTHVNEVALFWIAFIFTRPFGATFGDLLTKPIDHGGLNLGTIQASAVTIILFWLVLLASRKFHKLKPNH